MHRLRAFFARPLVRITSLALLVLVALSTILLANAERLQAHHGAQPISASEAASIVKAGQAGQLSVQADHAYLTTATGEYVFIKDKEVTVPQMLATLGVTSPELNQLKYTVEE